MERRLSRGLEALLGKGGVQSATSQAGQSVQTIPIESIVANPKQPRTQFNEERLSELRSSIERDGLLQPIVVRRVDSGYEIIAGERRFRACKWLGMPRIPAVIRAADEDQRLVLALVENLQRADLNPLEEAEAFLRLIDDFGLTHEEVAERVGRNRSTVSNTLRLLELPTVARDAVSRGTLSAGHARAMLPLAPTSGFDSFVRKVLDEGLSVRQTERVVREIVEGRSDEEVEDGLEPSPGPSKRRRRPLLTDLEDRLRARWGVLVRVDAGRRGGAITFKATSKEELNDLLQRLEDGKAFRPPGEPARESDFTV